MRIICGTDFSKPAAQVATAAAALAVRFEDTVQLVHVREATDPTTAICQTAERFGADLICLGTHGRSGLSAAVLGSVANGVMARSQRPLLTVPATKV